MNVPLSSLEIFPEEIADTHPEREGGFYEYLALANASLLGISMSDYVRSKYPPAQFDSARARLSHWKKGNDPFSVESVVFLARCGIFPDPIGLPEREEGVRHPDLDLLGTFNSKNDDFKDVLRLCSLLAVSGSVKEFSNKEKDAFAFDEMEILCVKDSSVRARFRPFIEHLERKGWVVSYVDDLREKKYLIVPKAPLARLISLLTGYSSRKRDFNKPLPRHLGSAFASLISEDPDENLMGRMVLEEYFAFWFLLRGSNRGSWVMTPLPSTNARPLMEERRDTYDEVLKNLFEANQFVSTGHSHKFGDVSSRVNRRDDSISYSARFLIEQSIAIGWRERANQILDEYLMEDTERIDVAAK